MVKEFNFVRAQSLCKAQSSQKSMKSNSENMSDYVVVTGNRKPKTGNKEDKLGPLRFELKTFIDSK